jgi:hypothetical protein
MNDALRVVTEVTSLFASLGFLVRAVTWFVLGLVGLVSAIRLLRPGK